MHLKELTAKAEIPQGVTATVIGAVLTLKGAKGELSRAVGTKRITATVADGAITLSCKNATRNDKRYLNTNAAHIKNMLKGVVQGHTYRLKICSGHFPMSVTLKGDLFEVKNFIGESVPRRLTIKPGVKVTIAGTDVTVESVSRELAGNQAGAIELLTRRPGFDRRVFQDGIYITEKDGKKV